MELGNTSYVILGMLAGQARSGYDIKQFADVSTRHFWAVSYGPIYPELKRLTQQGLIAVQEANQGDRRRNLYRLTAPGREALERWTADPAVTGCEIRDEMLLKLFFADATGQAERLRLVRAMRARHEATAATLRLLEAPARKGTSRMHHEVLTYGIGLHTWCAGWCAQLEARLTRGEGKTP